MNPNEIHFVAAHVRDALTSKDYLHVALVKNLGDPEVAVRFIARKIQSGRDAFRSSKDTREMTTISEGHALLKTKLRAIIPQNFGWWMEMDHDVEIRVRWLWLGHPAVTHSGSVSDCDLTIVLALLRNVDWDAEAKEAIDSVEAAEAALLKSAQDRRRLRLTNSAHTLALPCIETLAPIAPPTLAQKKLEMGPRRIPKRRLTSEELSQRLAEADEPVPKQVHAYDAAEDYSREEIEDGDNEHDPAPHATSATHKPSAVALSPEPIPKPQGPPKTNQSPPR